MNSVERAPRANQNPFTKQSAGERAAARKDMEVDCRMPVPLGVHPALAVTEWYNCYPSRRRMPNSCSWTVGSRLKDASECLCCLTRGTPALSI